MIFFSFDISFPQNPSLNSPIKSISILSLIGILITVLVTFTIQPLLFRIFVTNRAKKGLAPVKIRTFIQSFFLLLLYGLGGILLSIVSITILPLLPIVKKLKFNWLHKAMAKLVNENFDPKFFKVIEGGVAETKELLEQKFDKIFFTGSIPVGRIVYQAAAKHLTPVTLELGGKSPAFFTEKCDLKIGVKRMIWAKFLNAGQTCVAPDYILVHKAIKEDFLKYISDAFQENLKGLGYEI